MSHKRVSFALPLRSKSSFKQSDSLQMQPYSTSKSSKLSKEMPSASFICRICQVSIVREGKCSNCASLDQRINARPKVPVFFTSRRPHPQYRDLSRDLYSNQNNQSYTIITKETFTPGYYSKERWFIREARAVTTGSVMRKDTDIYQRQEATVAPEGRSHYYSAAR